MMVYKSITTVLKITQSIIWFRTTYIHTHTLKKHLQSILIKQVNTPSTLILTLSGLEMHVDCFFLHSLYLQINIS